jgi:uncharacterized protein YndB with AHSA1/START domain
MSERKVSVSRVINAPAQKIFDVVADPAMHPVIDGSGSVRTSNKNNPERLAQGAKFGMGMKIGAPYRVTNTVVEFEDGKRIGWQHAGKHIWRYELEPHEGATLVTESLDFTHARSKPLLVLLGPIAKKRYTDAMKATLERLDKQVTSG